MKVHVAASVLASGRGVCPGRAAGPAFVSTGGDLTDCPDGAVLVLPETPAEGVTGDPSPVAAIVTAERGTTSYPAILARELGVPLVGDVTTTLENGAVVTVDGDRGVVYESDVRER